MMATELQKKWEERINRAEKCRAEWADQFQVDTLRQYFEGNQNIGYPDEEWITVNKIYSHLMSQLPMLYSMDPYFYVKLKKSYRPHPEIIAAYEVMGRGRQAMLNYLKSELKLKTHARLAIQDAHFAYGVLKVRRASDEQDHPHAGEPMLTEDGEEILGEDGMPMVFPDTVPVNERYELDRVHPDDIIWGEDSGTLDRSWDFVAQRICMTKEEALEDSRFNKRIIRAVKGRARDDTEKESKGLIDRITNLPGLKHDDQFLDFWEIYDLKKKEWLMIVEGGEAPAIKPRPLPAGVECHPYAFLRFILRDNSPYPIPPMYPGLDPQKEYNLSRSRLLTHRKRFNRKYEVDVNKLEDPDVELSKLESGEDGAIIRVMAPGAVNPIKDAPLDQQSYMEISMLNADLVELLGSPDNSRGIAAADSATEAGLLDRRLEVKEGDRMSLVVDWVLDCAKKLDQLVQVHIDRDEAVRVTGPEGDMWVTVRERDYSSIEGEYEYSVNVGASQPRLPDIERSQWIAFMSQVVVPFPHILTSPTIMRRMAELFHIEDDAAIEEFRQLGLKIMSGQMPMPGGGGGGGAQDDPVAAVLGQALGPQGGNTNGGGAPE